MTMPLPRDLLARCARNFPDKLAYACGETTRTWREMDERSARLAGALESLGVRHGATVAILGQESLVIYEHFFACMKLGLLRVGFNWRYSADELGYLIDDSGAQVLLVDAACAAQIEPHRARLEQARVVLIGYGAGHGLALDYEQLLAKARAPETLPALSPDDALMLTYTSGTTGRPKGVVHRQHGITSMIFQSLVARGLSPDDVWYTAAASSWMTVVLNLLGLGNSMGHVISDGVFEMRAFLRDVERRRATAVMLVPTLIHRALQELRQGHYDISSIRLLMYGSAPATPQLIRDAYAAFGCEMIQSYGMTEAGWITQLGAADHRYALEHEPALLRSAGRAGVMSEIAIRDAAGNAVPAGTAGEVWIRSESLMTGYRNRPEETARALQGGWLSTNDVGFLDERGYLFLTDRRDFMIISGAVNIFPSRVEEALAEHAAVGECAVVGVPHVEWGEAVVAVLRLRDGHPAPSLSALQEHCSARLNRMERPKHFLFVPDFPRSLNGKVRKQDVKQWAAAQPDLPWARAAAPATDHPTPLQETT